MSLRTSINLKLDPAAAFNTLADDLTSALGRLGIELEPRMNGRVTAGCIEVGRIVRWKPPEEIVFEWLGEEWQPAKTAVIRLKFEPTASATCVTLEREDPDNLFGDAGEELAGWFASEVAAPILHAMTLQRLGDWITDRRARRPSGAQSCQIYRDPIYHRPNFKAILEILHLTSADYLIEVGCGGGAFLKDALASGCRAAAIDHSSDMARVAQEVNSTAIQENRLEIRQAEADTLPFPDNTFTCAVMTGVFGFIPDPVKALHEVRRVLTQGGRFVLFTGSKELRGTPAAPEPIASRLHFYEDQQLVDLARKAGFTEAHLEWPDYEHLAIEAGVPQEALDLFKGRGGAQLLVARRN